MLYREIIAVCSQIHINTLCGQNVELLNVKLAVYKQNIAPYIFKHVDSLLMRSRNCKK